MKSIKNKILPYLPLKEINILSVHGKQFVPDLRNAELPQIFRGRPIIESDISEEDKINLINICPTKCITNNPFSIDLGNCCFCKECHFLCPDKIRFTNDYKIATNNRNDLIIKQGINNPIRVNPDIIRPEIKSFFRNSLKLRQVSAGGDNSCEMELNAIGNVNFDIGRYGIEFTASARHADGILITGPISDNMASALQTCYDAIASPKIIILAGVDAISSGIFAGSKSLNRNFLNNHHIDLFIPGNPAHPLTIINGILDLIGKQKG